MMVEASNNAVAGKIEDEKLIANAKQVAVAVKQLVMASNVRGNLSDKLQYKVSDCAKKVAQGTSDIVEVAQKAGDIKREDASNRNRSKTRFGATGLMIRKVEQQQQILRLEKQLEEARKGYGNLHSSEYK